MADYIDRGDYTEIVCGTNETFRKDLSDGETWENYMLNIEASGASFRITAIADNWVLRNFGIKGQLDYDGAPTEQNFLMAVNSSSATGVVENIYHPGTSYSRGNPENFPSGIYVMKYHAGDIEIRNMYATDLPSHALYASTMASGNGGDGGTIRVYDSYCADTENSGWRIGSQGSYVDNCVSFRTVRGVWSRWGPTEVRNSDMGDNGTDLITANGGEITVDNNTRFGTTSGNVYGSSAGTPQEYVPEGCPTSAEAAASGSGGGGGGGTQPEPPDATSFTAEDFAHGDLSSYYAGSVSDFSIGDKTEEDDDGSGGGGTTEPDPDYESATLSEVSGDGNYDTTSDPAGSGQDVLRVWYPEGEHRGLNARFYFNDMVGHEPDVAHARYQLYVPTSFTLMSSGVHGGTKIPGMANHENGGAAGGNHNMGAAFSARMFYPRPGEDYDNTDGDPIPLALQVYDGSTDGGSDDYGWHEPWSEGGPAKGEWVTIDYRMQMNTPGETDGVIEGWVNGVKAYDSSDRTYLFRDQDHSDMGIRSWRWHFYFGGSWDSPEYNEIFARNFECWVGDNAFDVVPGDGTDDGGSGGGGDEGGTTTTVIDDFEWGGSESVTDYYTGNTSSLSVQTNTVLEGSYTLQGAEYYRTWWDGGETTPRGYEYRQDVQLADLSSSDHVRCYFAVPTGHNAGKPDSGYYVSVDADNNTLGLHYADDTELASTSQSINHSTHYQVGFRFGPTGESNNVEAVLYDSSGNTLASTAATDDSYSGGKHGWYFNKSHFVDNLRQIER